MTITSTHISSTIQNKYTLAENIKNYKEKNPAQKGYLAIKKEEFVLVPKRSFLFNLTAIYQAATQLKHAGITPRHNFYVSFAEAFKYAKNLNKSAFLKIKDNPLSPPTYTMSISDLKKRADDYKQKHAINLFVSDPSLKEQPETRYPDLTWPIKSFFLEGRRLAAASETEFIAYFYAGYYKNEEERHHVETLIFNKQDEVFNIVPFLTLSTLVLQPDPLSKQTNTMKYFRCPVGKDENALPQATERECASLGLAYAKEYLKNNAEQLYNFTLKIDAGDDQYLLSSPQVLRYSQSSFYCKLVHHFVSSEKNQITISRGKKEVTIKTLTGYIADKASIKTIDNKMLSKHDIKDFRKKWLDAYAKSMKKRDFMKDQTGSNHNQYLRYLANKNNIIINPSDVPWYGGRLSQSHPNKLITTA